MFGIMDFRENYIFIISRRFLVIFTGRRSGKVPIGRRDPLRPQVSGSVGPPPGYDIA